ncbi:MAG: aminoglycoside phosphotransferase (APT) family kinase protein [Gammaproteobacteria bacterium]|jgi:aminoglycoside phosphotransferase (APT) family kinase protein
MNESNRQFEHGRDLEPEIAKTLHRIHCARDSGPYILCKEDELRARLEPFLLREGVRNPHVDDLRRLAGGASKEQFVFTLNADGQPPKRCVLRLEPVEGVAITSRQRELEAIRAVSDVVPVPEVLWIDPDGDALGRPALITEFVQGVTKPSDTRSNITGFGTVMSESLREQLVVSFFDHLRAIHAIDIRSPDLKSFQIPDADPQQAARWQINWWTTVWHNDALQGIPVLGLAERWMRENLPKTAGLVLIHGDYRTGNYLFNEETAAITAILDWEFTHIGDYHEDLAWISLRPWSHTENGILLASSLFPYEELAPRYRAVSGREVDARTLHFYQVFCLYKCTVICLGSGLRAAHEAHNHQDALMSWLTPAGYVFMNELIDVIEQGPPV